MPWVRLDKSWVPALARWLASALLVLAAFLWWLLIGDVYTSMRYSSSYNWLSPRQTIFATALSVSACVLAASLTLFSVSCASHKCFRSYLLLAISLCLVPAAWLYSQHVAATTTDAVLEPRTTIRDTIFNP